eukprot:41720_1
MSIRNQEKKDSSGRKRSTITDYFEVDDNKQPKPKRRKVNPPLQLLQLNHDKKPQLIEMIQSTQNKNELWPVYKCLPKAELQSNLCHLMDKVSSGGIHRIYYKTAPMYDVFPHEMLHNVLQYLRFEDLCRSKRVSKIWLSTVCGIMNATYFQNAILNHKFLSKLRRDRLQQNHDQFVYLLSYEYDWRKAAKDVIIGLKQKDAILWCLAEKGGLRPTLEPIAYDDDMFFYGERFGYRVVRRWASIGDEGSFIPMYNSLIVNKSYAKRQYQMRSEAYDNPQEYNIVNCYAAIIIQN